MTKQLRGLRYNVINVALMFSSKMFLHNFATIRNDIMLFYYPRLM